MRVKYWLTLLGKKKKYYYHHKMKNISQKKGMTLAEIVVVIGILGIIMIAISYFQVNILKNNKYSFDSLSSTQDARSILRTMIKELRSASPSNNGSFPIIIAATNTLSFYSDVNADGLKEQMKYFIASSTLKKSVIIPSGSPLTYNSANEKLSILAYNIKNAATSSLFEYFDEDYSGTSTSLTQPVTITNVHLIKINLLIDSDPNRAPILRTYTSQVNLRNLKDNL
jgi:prepilin-type N-terminal cleavage/methylation domain-containing protein